MKYAQLLTRLAIAMPMVASAETVIRDVSEATVENTTNVVTPSFKKFEKILPDIPFRFDKFPDFYDISAIESKALNSNSVIKNYLVDKQDVLNALNSFSVIYNIDTEKKKRLFSTFCYDFHRSSTDKVHSKDLEN
jgi:hypothetical protein